MQPLQQQLDNRKLSFLLIERYKALLEGDSLPPYAIEIQPTHRCNYKCRHCSYLKRNEAWTSELTESDLESLRKSVNNLGVRVVYFSGAGEPLLSEPLRKTLHKFKTSLTELVLITNGSLLHLLPSTDLEAIKYIQVSVPAASKELHKKVTGSSTFSKVSAIPELIRSRCPVAKPQLTAMYVITKENVHEVELAPLVFKTLGFDFLRFRQANDYEDSGVGENLDLSRFKAIAESSREFTNLASILEPHQPLPVDKCHALELGLLLNVDPSGEVYLCTPDIGSSLSIGNIHEKSLQDIWNSRSSIVDTLQHRYRCGKCPETCRCHGYNQLFSKIVSNLPNWNPDPTPAA